MWSAEPDDRSLEIYRMEDEEISGGDPRALTRKKNAKVDKILCEISEGEEAALLEQACLLTFP